MARSVGLRLVGRLSTGIVALMGRILPPDSLDDVADEALRARFQLQEWSRRRRCAAEARVLPQIRSASGSQLERSVLAAEVPWSKVDVPEVSIPCMLTSEERQHYLYLSSFYRGLGDVVEIGPWLGASTSVLLRGLLANERFRGRRLHVFDDFVWRSEWMNPALAGSSVVAPANHASFEPLFRAHLADLDQHLEIARGRLAEFDGNESVAPLSWTGAPVEMMFVDCGRLLEVNEAWYRIFAPSFIKDVTLLVLQDWQHHKRVPEVSWENMKLFTDRKGNQLELIHELLGSGTAVFLYRGPQ